MTTLITDLDNTLYDWVTFFASAFDAMLGDLQALLGVPRTRLIDEFKEVHQRHGSSERPFAALELPSVRRHFGDMDSAALARNLEGPFATFEAVRRRTLTLYPGVRETLKGLHAAGVVLLAHTEAPAVNAYQRLVMLDVADYFDRIYVRDGSLIHPDPQRQAVLDRGASKIRVVRPEDRKPEPGLLLDICEDAGAALADTWYVGDSLTRDIAMANGAGVRSIWAEYGTHYDPHLWQLLVSISHWSADDVAREATLRELLPSVRADFIISSFDEVLGILGVRMAARAAPSSR